MKILNFLKTYYVSVIGAGIVLAILIYGGLQACETSEFNRQVNTQINQANAAVKQAANAQNAAANFDIERRSEDAVREKTINPRLNESRRRSNVSKADLEKSRKNYDNEKTNTQNLSSADADNCRKLGELFPNVEFSDCR